MFTKEDRFLVTISIAGNTEACFTFDQFHDFGVNKSKRKLIAIINTLEKRGMIEKRKMRTPRSVRVMTKRQKIDFDDFRKGKKIEGYEFGVKEKYRLDREQDAQPKYWCLDFFELCFDIWPMQYIEKRKIAFPYTFPNSTLYRLTKNGRDEGRRLKKMLPKEEVEKIKNRFIKDVLIEVEQEDRKYFV